MWLFKKNNVEVSKSLSDQQISEIQRRLVKQLTNMREEYYNQAFIHDRKYIDLVVKIEGMIYREIEAYKQENSQSLIR